MAGNGVPARICVRHITSVRLHLHRLAKHVANMNSAALNSIFNKKHMFIASMILFEAGSALCGAAPTMNALIVGRVIAGVGGSGVYIGILNYFATCTTPTERGAYMSGMGLVWGVGAVLGPVVGGSFSTSSATWRWSFYLNLSRATPHSTGGHC